MLKFTNCWEEFLFMRSLAIVWRSCGLCMMGLCCALTKTSRQLKLNQMLEQLLMYNLNNSNLSIPSLVDDGRLLASQIPQIHFKHCYREANRRADRLARMGGTQGTTLIFYDSLLEDLFNFIDFDLSDLYLARPCHVNLIMPQLLLILSLLN